MRANAYNIPLAENMLKCTIRSKSLIIRDLSTVAYRLFAELVMSPNSLLILSKHFYFC